MHSKHARLDRFISCHTGIKRRTIKPLLARGLVNVDGKVARDAQQRVGEFSHIALGNRVLQSNRARYLMLNKPAGVVSATRDDKHQTILDLLAPAEREGLHIVGRLDFNSTGLILLTNDGRWSKALSSPECCVVKLYRVTLADPITPDVVHAFADGMYFGYEDITTQPASLNIISEHVAEVGLTEGRYHQIKRMFGRFQNEVIALHRTAVGKIVLDAQLKPGQSRPLSTEEIETCLPSA